MFVLYIFLALLLILLCSRYGVVVSYIGSEFSLLLRFGFFTFHIPKIKKKPKKKPSPKPETQEEKPKEEKPKKEKKKKFSLPPLDRLPELVSMAMKALGRIFRSIKIDELMLHLGVASSDPYNTAMTMNYANEAAEILLDGGLLKVKKQDVAIYPDFTSEKMTVDGKLAVSLRLYKLIAAALALLVGYLRWRRKQKKSAEKAERT